MGTTTARLHISALAALQPRVVSALSTLGLTSAELGELFYRHLSATCVQCELGLTGEELSQLALAESAEQLGEPKLARLRQGYCGRDGCDSYYYNVRFEDHPRVNWEILIPALKTAPPPPAAPTPAPDRAEADAVAVGWRAWVASGNRRIVLGLALLLILLVVRHFWLGGRVPFLHAKPHYRINTNSIPGVPPPPQPPPPAPTNR
jgi:hypothetical protein